MVKINLLFMLLLATLSSFSQLTVIENYFDGQGGIEGLESPTDMEIDSSGNMYIVGNSSYLHLFMHENAEYANFVELQNATINHEIFTRKEGQDRLMHLKTIENNTDLELGYAVFTDLSISQDGKNLYLAREVANLQNSLMVFSIDSLSGDITLRNKITDVQNINNIICNNQFVYTTSRGDSENSIRVYQRTNDNNIVLVQKINAADSISQIKSITLSADNRFYMFRTKNSSDGI
ncbi:MAG: hypothetical protein IPF54_08870 [Draconibacterium sp.]|nr:hypothetical protein [Draconibacterium sp.]